MENLPKDHSRHYVPGEGGYDGLTGNERGTSEEVGNELRSSRVQNGSQNGGSYRAVESHAPLKSQRAHMGRLRWGLFPS